MAKHHFEMPMHSLLATVLARLGDVRGAAARPSARCTSAMVAGLRTYCCVNSKSAGLALDVSGTTWADTAPLEAAYARLVRIPLFGLCVRFWKMGVE